MSSHSASDHRLPITLTPVRLFLTIAGIAFAIHVFGHIIQDAESVSESSAAKRTAGSGVDARAPAIDTTDERLIYGGVQKRIRYDTQSEAVDVVDIGHPEFGRKPSLRREEVEWIKQLPSVKTLNLQMCPVHPEDLTDLLQVHKPRSVVMLEGVRDDTCYAIYQCPSIEEASILGGWVELWGVVYLSRMAGLRRVRLRTHAIGPSSESWIREKFLHCELELHLWGRDRTEESESE